jgi:hypothetical protein
LIAARPVFLQSTDNKTDTRRKRRKATFSNREESFGLIDDGCGGVGNGSQHSFEQAARTATDVDDVISVCCSQRLRVLPEQGYDLLLNRFVIRMNLRRGRVVAFGKRGSVPTIFRH